MRLSISSSSSSSGLLSLSLSLLLLSDRHDGSNVVSSFQLQPLTSLPTMSKLSSRPSKLSAIPPTTIVSDLVTTASTVSASAASTATATSSLLSSSISSSSISSSSISSSTQLIASSITAPIGSISVLAFVILIHELGHFLAARSFNINVQEFSVGVGPKIFGFRRNVETGVISFGEKKGQSESESESDGTNSANSNVGNPKNMNKKEREDEGDGKSKEIEFNLRAIPLGGYVRFPENYNMTQEFQLEVKAEEKREEIQRVIQEQKQKMGETKGKNGAGTGTGAGAGFVASITSIWDGYTNPEKQKEERLLALETMAKKSSKYNSSSNSSSSNNNWFSGLLFNNKNKIKNNNQQKKERSIIIEEDGTVSTPPIEYYDDPNLLQNRGWGQRAVVLAGGVVFNILLAFTLYFGELTIGGGMLRPTFDQGALISSMPKVDGPSAGILSRGDVILALNGQPLSSSTSPSVYKSQEAISQFISKIRTTTPGEALHLSVLKSNTKSISEVDIYPSPMNPNDPNSPLSIGVMLGPNFKGQETIKASSVGNAVSIASIEVYESTTQTAQSILTYLGTLLQGKSGSSTGQSLSGPIGVIKAGSDVVSTNNVSAVIGFMAAISINLAVVNALPLPALDGGQMIFVLAEAVTGRKVDQRLQESINSAALLFLLVVTFSTAIGDISKIAVK